MSKRVKYRLYVLASVATAVLAVVPAARYHS